MTAAARGEGGGPSGLVSSDNCAAGGQDSGEGTASTDGHNSCNKLLNLGGGLFSSTGCLGGRLWAGGFGGYLALGIGRRRSCRGWDGSRSWSSRCGTRITWCGSVLVASWSSLSIAGRSSG